MRRRKKLLLTLGIPVALLVLVFAVSLWVLFTRNYSETVFTPVPATYVTTINSSSERRDYSSAILTLSYPPGWTMKECRKDCLDVPMISLYSEKESAFFRLSYYSPAADCSTTQVQQWRAWHDLTLPYVMTKDGVKIDMVEGLLAINPRDPHSLLQHNIYAKIITQKKLCIDIHASDGKDAGIIKSILENMVVNK